MAESIVVLHVDDEPDFADLVAEYLERQDERLEVVTETSAEEGLTHLDNGTVDCIVSDYDMPRTDGLEFLEAVREHDPDRPFILFTGKGSEEVASEALSRGATDYLQKQPGVEQYEILANRVLNYVETAEQEAQRRRQLDAIETADEGIGILDADGEFIYVNRAYADLYGYEPEEIVGEHWGKLYPDFEIERAAEEIHPALDERGTWSGETIGLRADGSTFIEDHTLSRTDRGELICTVRDVTERRERKRELEQYRTIVEAMGDGVYALGADGRVVHVNDVVLEMLGYTYDEFVDAEMDRFFDEADIDRFEAAIQALLAEDDRDIATVTATAVDADGEEIPIEVSLTLLPMEDDEFRGTVGVVRDISDRQHRHDVLRQYENAFNSAQSALALADEDGRLTLVNPAFLELWGYEDPEALQGRHVSEFCVDAEVASEVTERVRTDGEWTGELLAERADGERFTVDCAASVVTDENDNVVGMMASFLNVSERAEREAELERYETLLELMPDTVVVTDLEGYITDIHGFEGWSGYEYDELVGSHMSKTTPEAGVERAENVVADLILSEDKTKATFEYAVGTKDGERIPFENHITLLPPDENGEIPGTMSVLRDISERKARERELRRQNERLEEFAGIVSHDLRNPLNVAAGRLTLARDECDSEHLEAVDGALDRMDTLIQDLLALSRERQPVEDFETLTIGEVAESCWGNVETNEATLTIDADRRVEADESRLKQLLENLLRNAVEHGGEDVTVRIGTLDDEGGFFIADDGPGIPVEHREEVFKSGFSTTDGGTGFGLSIVKEVAEAHGWDVSVIESESGGARFELRWTDRRE